MTNLLKRNLIDCKLNIKNGLQSASKLMTAFSLKYENAIKFIKAAILTPNQHTQCVLHIHPRFKALVSRGISMK